MYKKLQNYLVLFFSLFVLSGCGTALVGGAATLGLATVQERSLKDAAMDLEIDIRIQDELFRANTEKIFAAVDVIVIEQRVLLVGSVENTKYKDIVASIAWNTPEVREVLNEITINKNLGLISEAKDARISINLTTLLIGDIDISDINFSHSVSNQIVYIIGIAQNEEELNKVINHARAIQGAKKVISHIILKNDNKRKK